MTRYSHQHSVRSEGKVSAGRSLRHGSPVGSSVGHRSSDRDDFSHGWPTIGAQPPNAFRKEVSHLREKVIMARLELREKRVGMRQQHCLVRSLETRLLKHWQRYNVLTEQDVVTHLHGELCAALDKLGPLQEDHDELEDGLDTLEYDLEAKEARFYEQHTQVSPDGSDGSPSTQRLSTSTLSDELDQDYLSPQYHYYSRIGDAKIARERLMDLEAQRTQYLDIERERDALGIPPYQENTDFLSQYDAEYAEHRKELEKIEMDIESLGIQAGISNAKERINMITFHDPQWDAETNTGTPKNSPATDPGEAGRSGPSLEGSPRRRSENDIWNIPNDPRSRRDRINQWILERLKDSKVERARHKAELNNPSLDPDAWWSLVCQFWQLDRAARSSKSSSRHASGRSSSAQAQERSLDLNLNAASIALQMAIKPPSVTHEAVLVTNYANQSISQLNYLDLATGPLAKTRNILGKWDSVLGC
ncbi:MAG: hypothetical protein Q9209_001034 [Squamulea sp. 1 TL-2023]